MELSQITFILFALFSGLRTVSYIPQIHRVATDKNGASAIAYSTWSLWIGANIATALYAFINLKDLYLGTVSLIFTVCCVAVVTITVIKRRHFGASTGTPLQMPPLPWRAVAIGMMAVGALIFIFGLGAALVAR